MCHSISKGELAEMLRMKQPSDKADFNLSVSNLQLIMLSLTK